MKLGMICLGRGGAKLAERLIYGAHAAAGDAAILPQWTSAQEGGRAEA